MFFSASTPLKNHGLYCIAVLFSCLAAAFGASAEPATGVTMPSLFDVREKIARPDMSNVVRIRFLTSLDFPPFNFLDQSGKLSGFNIDLVREICSELDVLERCQLQAQPFGELQADLVKGAGEAIVAGVQITPELRRDFAFTRPLIPLPARFVHRKMAGQVAGAQAILKGSKVGVVEETTHFAMLKAWFPQVTPIGYATRDAMLEALQKGEIDTVFGDGLQLTFWVGAAASKNCCEMVPGSYISTRFLGEGLSIMVKKADAKLIPAFDHAILALERNGRLNEIYLRYFPDGLY
jgi:polar amino acid transport system substrate-binding protein